MTLEQSHKNELRKIRKDEHIKYFLQSEQKYDNGFSDVIVQNNSLPELDFDDLDTSCEFMNKTIDFPMIINAMTGGTDYTLQINESLSRLASRFNIPIAVGSQTIALEHPESAEAFKVVRRMNPEGVVIANISAGSDVHKAVEACEIIHADALQLHLNAAQELSMKEGDRCFKGILSNIGTISSRINLPVIAKEVGFGMSIETARRLKNEGIRHIDISGFGGTNFTEIESMRNRDKDMSFLYAWGIPTALSLIECRKLGWDLHITCTGGITKSEEIVKALCLGANLVGISGALLRELMVNGYEAAEAYIEQLIYETKVLMLLLGAGKIDELYRAQYLLKGQIKDLYEYKFWTRHR